MRRIVALLASAAALGGLVELAMLRHWEGSQLIPWFVLALVAGVGVATAAGGPRRLAQVTGVVAVLTAGIGAWQHLTANLALGPQLARYAQTWDSMSTLEQWWLAGSGAIGSAPLLAPGMVALAGVLLVVAVLDRP